MARDWRHNEDYRREDFSAAVREALGLLGVITDSARQGRGSSWLGALTGIHKRTLSAALRNKRSLPRRHRAMIADAVAVELQDQGGTEAIERLYASAGLPVPQRSETRRIFLKQTAMAALAGLACPTAPPPVVEFASSLEELGRSATTKPDHVLLQMKKAQVLYHEEGRILKALAIWRDVAGSDPASRAAFRASLNSSLALFSMGEVASAEIEATRVFGIAMDHRAWRICAEAKQVLGRISLRRENYTQAIQHFTEGDGLLDRLPRSQFDVELPRGFPLVGHSFIISHEHEIPSQILRGGNKHFIGKTSHLQALRPGSRFWWDKAVQNLEAARRIDQEFASDPRGGFAFKFPHLGFDLLWQFRTACQTCGDLGNAKDLLAMSVEHFDYGAGRREWYIAQALLTALTDEGGCRFRPASALLDSANSLLHGPSLSGLAKIYRMRGFLYRHYRPRGWERQSFCFALAAAALQPYPSLYDRLSAAARAMRESANRRDFLKQVEGIVEEVSRFPEIQAVRATIAGWRGKFSRNVDLALGKVGFSYRGREIASID